MEQVTHMTRAELIKTIQGLLAIAELAMPDTYYQSDSRVKRARKLMERLECSDILLEDIIEES
jgi:4-hydroxyphenylpyruvate dioxygenase-like putative hemolysin